jgi:hypothetical protein
VGLFFGRCRCEDSNASIPFPKLTRQQVLSLSIEERIVIVLNWLGRRGHTPTSLKINPLKLQLLRSNLGGRFSGYICSYYGNTRIDGI